ncbi:MAG: hypothetical protein Kow0063_07790 [Anaerolineae bacterium]
MAMPGAPVYRHAWGRGGGYASARLLAGAEDAADELANFFGDGGKQVFLLKSNQ